jgi:hypothetical protein
MIGGRLFLNTPLSIGASIDAKTEHALGLQPEELRVGDDHDDRALESAWRRLLDRRPGGADFWGTGDGYLIAVDARPACLPGVRRHGRVDLMQGLPFAVRGNATG